MAQEPRPTSEDFKQQAKNSARTWSEELNVAGTQLVDKLKDLTHEGNVRNVKIKHDGRVLVELPLTAAVAVGGLTTLVAPQIAILTAIAGVLTHCTVEIEHTGEPPAKTN
jgi:hypothetical protein